MQCVSTPTTPSLQSPGFPALPPCLGRVLTGLFPRQSFLPFQPNSRPDDLPGPHKAPQQGPGPRPLPRWSAAWSRLGVGAAGEGLCTLIHPPARWSVQVAETLTTAPKGRLLLLLSYLWNHNAGLAGGSSWPKHQVCFGGVPPRPGLKPGTQWVPNICWWNKFLLLVFPPSDPLCPPPECQVHEGRNFVLFPAVS